MTSSDTDTDAATPEAMAAAEVVSPQRWSRPLRWTALGTAVLLPTAAAVFYFTRYDDNQSVIDAQHSAREAACDYVRTLTNYDSKNVDTYVTSVLAGASGDFKTEFAKTSTELAQVIVAAQITSAIREAHCGIATGDENHAEVVVALSLTISSLGTEGKPVPSQMSLVATMDKIDNHWLVSKLDAPALQPSATADAGQAALPGSVTPR
ncbi:hypothetical protein [Nocardia sp. NBC_00511]|uniref:hypothetical protein n=1 Tax=Nocardia sp. NBC_00511 TaxID=2903591 RepID=UPI0030E3040A